MFLARVVPKGASQEESKWNKMNQKGEKDMNRNFGLFAALVLVASTGATASFAASTTSTATAKEVAPDFFSKASLVWDAELSGPSLSTKSGQFNPNENGLRDDKINVFNAVNLG